MDDLMQLKFEEVTMDESLQGELQQLEEELSGCGLACGGTIDPF
ncbi:MAG: hypothetical protein SPL15_06630 [Lachnospiraceae bacterium]|nr:hypothetical protein [Lachnospiraceae bacterium]MDY5742651.1 hypothetical protein [Lachnospiraceae bacterium]